MKQHLSRRNFLRTSGATLAAISGAPSILRAENRGDKMRIAFIGVGGINARHVHDVATHGDICAAYCDIDPRNMGNIGKSISSLEESGKGALAKEWKNAKGYTDYREMFAKDADKFDAVMIGTPDHTHYPATVMAANHKKHVFTQKPLTHTVWEARQLTALPDMGLATQMGNQGHANEGNRIITEYVKGGYLGNIKEVHCFTDRPIWPQGMSRPEDTDELPEGLNWDAWIGSAPMRPYKKDIYHAFYWRGWKDFGAGALGDMACHTMDSIFMSLDPGSPESVELIDVKGTSDDAFPKGSTLKWTFGAKGDRPGFAVYWYDGINRPETFDGLAEGQKLPSSGNVYVGSEASLLVTGDYGDSCRIIPESKHREIAGAFKEKTGSPRPPQILERSPGHHSEWRMACIGDKPVTYPGSNFGYAGPFTETILLGNVCLAFPDTKLEWDGIGLKFKGNDAANKLLTKAYRKGWDFKLA